MGQHAAAARRRGGRLVGLVVVCLMAGLVVQTLVAIGIMKYSTSRVGVAVADDDANLAIVHREDRVIVIRTFSRRGMHVFELIGQGSLMADPPSARGHIPRWVSPPAPYTSSLWRALGFGWPWPSLCGSRSDRYGSYMGPAQPTRWQQRLGLNRHDLPSVQPIPLNTLANSAFYGLLVSPLWLVAIKARRVWRGRFRRGMCVHCGYALAGLPAAAPCPECGKGSATPR